MNDGIRVIDARRRELVFDRPPARVVSLVPSDTYNLFALGCGDRLVGRTDYCELPSSVKELPSVGGTKDAKLKNILALSPDLVLANQEENSRPLLEGLAVSGIKVFVAFPKRVIDGVSHLARLARIFRLENDPSVRKLIADGYKLSTRTPLGPRRVFCPIWKDPWMTANGDTYVSDVLRVCGYENIFADRERRYPLSADLDSEAPSSAPGDRDVRYPRVTLEEVFARNPELVLLPDEPYAFEASDAELFRGRGVAVQFVSGKALTWYGAMFVHKVKDLVFGSR